MMIDEGTIERAAKALLGAVPPGSRVILFGSYAAGRAGPEIDLDFLVVEPEINDSFAEMARLSRLLGRMLIPADVVVVSRDVFERFRDTPNTLPHEASREGRVYESVA